ncbi:hypothetical protein [Nocardioides sp.]|uniref:hypothetical protein n=1 Tax=Nocardioides sp. TaxID=35761 RepID=UPI003D0EBE92
MNSAYIDLAIGLALAFFLLSLLVSGLNELMVRILGVRAKFLWASLEDLLDRPGERSRTPSGVLDIVGFSLLPSRDRRPSLREFPTVPEPRAAEPAQLTAALHDRISGIDFGSRKLGFSADRARRTTINQVPPKRLALAVMEVVDGSYDGRVEDLLAGLERAKSPFFAPLKAIVAGAGGDRDRVRDGVESWFDSEMNRLTAVYRRHTRWVIASFAVFVTLFVGFDATAFAGSLLDDQAKREQIVAAASSADDTALRSVCTEIGESDTVKCFSAVIGNPALADAFDTSLVRFSPTGADAQVRWNWSVWGRQVRDPGHVVGMGLTMVALLFGAPFWWEALRRLMGMRTRRPTSAGGQ